MTDTLTPDIPAIKQKQQATWSSGNYAVIGTTLQIVGESLLETLDLPADAHVLDVAAGNGNATLAAARRGANVVASDYVETLLEGTRNRAAAEGLPIETRLADAENLPFESNSFDATVSTFGVMFVPDPVRAGRELLRVTRPGGHIGLANWTPEGFIGQMFKIVGAHVPPPAGIPSPLRWGTEAGLDEYLGDGASIEVERKDFVFRYRSAEHFVDVFRTYYGPTHKAFAALDEAGAESFAAQLVALCNEHNRSTDGALTVPSEYLEVVGTVR